LIVGILFGSFFIASNMLADWDEYYENEHDEHYERSENNESDRSSFFTNRSKEYKYSNKYLQPVNNPVYKEECSACHFLYLPGLLPSDSWKKIMDSAYDHFGEDLFLEEGTLREIKNYLLASSAEKIRSKRSMKILRSLGSKSPLKITNIPYIKRKHREISASVFKRETVGSLSNCDACHTTASQGDFEEDNVRIPR
jgi:hypothetical protein